MNGTVEATHPKTGAIKVISDAPHSLAKYLKRGWIVEGHSADDTDNADVETETPADDTDGAPDAAAEDAPAEDAPAEDEKPKPAKKKNSRKAKS